MVADWMKRYAEEGLQVRFTVAPPDGAEEAPAGAVVIGNVGTGAIPANRLAPAGGVNRADKGMDGDEERPGEHPSKIRGKGIVYDETTLIGEWFYERIMPGAVTESLASRDILSRYNHERLLGRVGNGSLVLTDGEDALRYEVEPNPNSSAGRDALAYVERGDLGGSSFAFVDEVVEHEKKYKDGLDRFTVRKCRLYELGPVDTPAYAGTGKPEARSDEVREHWRRVVTSRERLASGGVARDEARAMIARMDLLNLRLRFAPETR